MEAQSVVECLQCFGDQDLRESESQWHREVYCIMDSYYKHSRQLINKSLWTISVILWIACNYLSVAIVYCYMWKSSCSELQELSKFQSLISLEGTEDFSVFEFLSIKKCSLLCVTHVQKHYNQSRNSWHQETLKAYLVFALIANITLPWKWAQAYSNSVAKKKKNCITMTVQSDTMYKDFT